ncbi:MAG: hypothetical protein NTX88_02345 [Candidatus Atribacteria bacterium]|nr:hypothetical protein [Candidatus Atribacteria bacterium]
MSRITYQQAFQNPLILIGKSPIILIPALIAAIVGIVLSFAMRNIFLSGMSWRVFLFSMISLIPTFFCLAWNTLLMQHYYEGKNPSLQMTWIRLSEQITNVAIAFLLVAVLTSLGTFLFVIPGVFISTLLVLIVPHTAVTNETFDKSIPAVSRFLFSENNFVLILVLILVGFGLNFIPYLGTFLANLFYSIYIPYAYLKGWGIAKD